MVRTDHGALTYLLRFRNPEGQMARWLEILGSYNFEIQHRSGVQHRNANGLSRRPCSSCRYCEKQETKDLNSRQKESNVEECCRVTTRSEKKNTTSDPVNNVLGLTVHHNTTPPPPPSTFTANSIVDAVVDGDLYEMSTASKAQTETPHESSATNVVSNKKNQASPHAS